MKISFDYHCKEAESSFVKNENGEFCSKCQEEVIDLRFTSPRKIKEMFRKNPYGFCSMMFDDQLELMEEKHSFPKAAAFSLVGFLALGAGNNLHAQANQVEKTEISKECEASDTNERLTYAQKKEKYFQGVSKYNIPGLKTSNRNTKGRRVYRIRNRYFTFGGLFPFILVRKKSKLGWRSYRRGYRAHARGKYSFE